MFYFLGYYYKKSSNICRSYNTKMQTVCTTILQPFQTLWSPRIFGKSTISLIYLNHCSRWNSNEANKQEITSALVLYVFAKINSSYVKLAKACQIVQHHRPNQSCSTVSLDLVSIRILFLKCLDNYNTSLSWKNMYRKYHLSRRKLLDLKKCIYNANEISLNYKTYTNNTRKLII